MSTTPTCPRCQSTDVEAHMTPMHPKHEDDVWAPVREYGFVCKNCKLTEICANDEDGYQAFCERWKDVDTTTTVQDLFEMSERRRRDDDAEKRAWMWPDELPADHGGAPTNASKRREKLAESRTYDDYTIEVAQERGRTLPEFKYGYPVGPAPIAAVLARPDDDQPRLDYAQWLRTFDNSAAQATASFIEWQIRMAQAARQDPRADLSADLPRGVFARRPVDESDPAERAWRRWPGPACRYGNVPGTGELGLGESLNVLLDERLIDSPRFFRGFIEHVVVRASRFLEIAEELYSLAPIRQLTLTYCKGPQHTDEGLFRALLESPHLDRIRSIRLPVRVFGRDNEYTELNRFTDADVAALASSKHLRRLAHLDLSDHRGISVRSFDALASSTELPMLSFVGHDIYQYGYAGEFTFGNMGKATRFLIERRLTNYVSELEARHGRIDWLHPVENYGAEEPDVEAVVEHPFPPSRN